VTERCGLRAIIPVAAALAAAGLVVVAARVALILRDRT
jgi:hypothetical protein